MRLYQQCSSLLLLVHILLLVAISCNANYDEDFCTSIRGSAADADDVPYFYDDFSVLVEKTIFDDESQESGEVVFETMQFSTEKKEQSVSLVTSTGKYWAYIDSKSNDCIYKQGSKKCMVEHDCANTVEDLDFTKGDDGFIELGTGSEKLDYPEASTIKHKFNLGKSTERGINTIKLGTCAYDSNTQETIVSIFHILRAEDYSDLDSNKNILIMSDIRTKKATGAVTYERADYTDYKKLTSYEISNGLQIGEDQCGSVKSKFTMKELPKPPRQTKYTEEVFYTDGSHWEAFDISASVEEYNYDTKLDISVYNEAVNGQSEKETKTKVYDYNAINMYDNSVSNGNCMVTPNSITEEMVTPETYWNLDKPNPTYLGVYSNRNIPCDVWHFEDPDEPGSEGLSLYLATSEWLKGQGKPADAFFPVAQISKASSFGSFVSYFEYRNNPGYDIPYLPGCFDEDNILNARLNLRTNPNDIIPRATDFTYELRTALQKISGIVSPIRIGYITVQASKTSSEEALISFIIFDKFKNEDDSFEPTVDTDPITSAEAAKKINTVVDKGDFKFTLNNQEVVIKFKKNSFATAGLDDQFKYMDSSSLYSSGVMAAVALVVLIISLALGTVAVLGYKRWTESGRSGLSFGMKKMNEEL
ncbi:hypothetical protein PoB_003285900 [Plakobranchus ocellatus]|uniref:Uncharacterized protein n=1 Tax=Plakobranchus ocellatus TaxID=259542 RepID=A0AAV4AIU8_9GAST|nr:hypothetical protein PoB_003285900 [Plakobranchus ocellatus]